MSAHADAATNSAGDLARLSSHARRSWRILLVAYLVPMTIATHWPRLGFGAAGPIDKVIHFLGFGMVAWIAMHALVRRHAWIAWLAALAWVYVDERTQAIPVLGRVFSLHDMIAGWVGVLFAGLLHACRARSEPSDSRAEIDALTYGRGINWLFAAGIVLCVVLLLGGAMFAREVAGGAPATWAVAVYPVGFSGLVGLAVATAIVERVAARRVFRPSRPAWAMLLVVPATAILYGSYLAMCLLLFGLRPSEELATDAEGFAFLQRTVLVVSAIVALALARAVALDLAPRAAAR